ncbi:site-specific integrase [Massilia sp. LC238]|uniref:site-specific integrase n=1 Tax=Massilia sp. LC238 TaxID=1502852 RepID=UPI0004E40011|nr:site-specific integrase [Massilia sp. LC238]KFC76199.1 hypothetical protein FG94_00291 [Massilia sp. LC238]
MTKSSSFILDVADLTTDLNQTARPTSQPGDFRWDGDLFVHVGVGTSDCSSLNFLGRATAQSFRDHILKFSRTRKYSPIVLTTCVSRIAFSLASGQFQTFDESWVLKALDNKKFLREKGVVKSFFMYWHDRYPDAISESALQFLAKTLPSPKGARNALSDDPEKSWLTENEFDALLHRVWENYDAGKSGTQLTLLRLLSMQYARRPVQLAQLKIGDFRDGAANDGALGGREIFFPGAKDRRAENSFRDSKSEVHPVADHLWNLFQIQKHELKQLYEDTFQFSLTEDELDQLPVFADQTQLLTAITELTNHYKVDWRVHLGSRLFHTVPTKVGKYVAWTVTGPAEIWRDGRRGLARLEPPLSHRTGKPLQVTATRLRHTRARQLARLGMAKHVLSFWLGHTYEQSLDAYYNDPAEEARRIDEAMGGALVPLAMSFTGKLLDDDSHASRAYDPESSLEFAHEENLSKVGTCGKHSFCATTTVPVPCYRCKHFEPLVYAPHVEVLNALLRRQDEENAMIKIGGSRQLLCPIDLAPDIRAVQACIDRCNVRKKELQVKNG